MSYSWPIFVYNNFLAMDVLAPTMMKNAAKCDTLDELQNLVNHQLFERTLRLLVFQQACLFECQQTLFSAKYWMFFGGLKWQCSDWTALLKWLCQRRKKLPCSCTNELREVTYCQVYWNSSWPEVLGTILTPIVGTTENVLISNQAEKPAEFKHIIKRRKRN